MKLTKVLAIKNYICDTCKKDIKEKTEYTYMVDVVDGNIESSRYHTDCKKEE